LTAVVFGGFFANPTGPPHLFCAAASKGLQNCDQRLKKSFSTESAGCRPSLRCVSQAANLQHSPPAATSRGGKIALRLNKITNAARVKKSEKNARFYG
jgi:hypothetical protein